MTDQQGTTQILVVDDEAEIAAVVRRLVHHSHYAVVSARSLREARTLIATRPFQLVILDLSLPDGNGIELLRENPLLGETVSIIVLSAHVDIPVAVEATRLGAQDVIEKFQLAERLKSVIKGAISHEMPRPAGSDEMERIVGNSEVIETLRIAIRRIAHSDSSVLITGETGTGKELVARAIHSGSSRKDAPFVAADCAAINASTFESELFGHTAGAFTGAVSEHPGLIRSSHGGSLLLDEIGELPEPLQARLLRTLQEREVRPVGGLRPIPFDTRVLVATNRDLASEIESGRFRTDLFFRISTLRLEVPPLRDRGEDVILLFRHFLARDGGTGPSEVREIAAEVREILLSYHWPGNVRELQNVAHHVHTFADLNSVTPKDLPDYLRSRVEYEGGTDGKSIRDMEREAIVTALREFRGNRRLTARRLGISEATLYRRLKEYGITSDRPQ
jgi:DNA-binding NtrC family response regulator